MTADASVDFRAKLRLAVARLPKPVRYRAVNALEGFDRAIRLLEIDREMASFRAITAQEEAAAALFCALQLRNYPGASGLNLGSHKHKAALWPVIDAARMAVGRGAFSELDFRLSVDPPRIDISTPFARMNAEVPDELAGMRVTFVEPLDMLHRSNGAVHLFEKELAEIAEVHGRKDIGRHIVELTNQRNTLLYASNSGLPGSRVTAEGIEVRRQLSEIALCVAIAILQTWRFQAYAGQALETLLRLVAKADGVEMPYPDPDAAALTLKRGAGRKGP